MELFYHPEITKGSQTFAFGPEESRHIHKVLRHKAGDSIQVTDGKGRIYTCILQSISLTGCSFRTLEYICPKPKTFQIHLAVAATKSNDRYEWLVEKAVEIGMDELSPIICKHSERKFLKTERLQKIAISAMKQSLSPLLPKINPCISFSEFIRKNTEYHKFIAHCRSSESKQPLKNMIPKAGPIVVCIGPEGDFSDEETALARNYGYIAVSLGQYRLRTETAAIVACHTATLMNET